MPINRNVDSNKKDVTVDGDPVRVVHPTVQKVRIQDGDDANCVDVTPFDGDNVVANMKGMIVRNFNYGYDGSTFDRLRSDPYSKTLVTCDLDTYLLHEELQFVASHLFSAVATTNVVYMRILPHATTIPRLGYIIQSDGACKIEVVEGTTYTDNGTAVTAYNRHRNSANATDQLLYHTPTINSLGTVISTNLLGTAGHFTGAGDRLLSNDWMLKASTDILLKITNISGDNSEILIKFNFNECS